MESPKKSKRSADVTTLQDEKDSNAVDMTKLNFSELYLSKELLQGLRSSGYMHPSPVQLKAIPIGRFGCDLIAQAKSGTGKTCVFVVIVLENITYSCQVNALIMAPTRELAMQIRSCILILGKYINNLETYACIGGLSLSEDRAQLKPRPEPTKFIVTGTPGRLKQLIQLRILGTASIRIAVLDEADKLLEDGFFGDVNAIIDSLPDRKQVMAFSATFPTEIRRRAEMYMRKPQFVQLCTEEEEFQTDAMPSASLIGVTQYYCNVDSIDKSANSFHKKQHMVIKILNQTSFYQCIVFCNQKARAESLINHLTELGWACDYISSSLSQEKRTDVMNKMIQLKVRILVSTDLIARGIDLANVNLVISIDIPQDVQTYLHRIGRTGRFGTAGVAVSLLTNLESIRLVALCKKHDIDLKYLPGSIPADLYSNPVPHVSVANDVIQEDESSDVDDGNASSGYTGDGVAQEAESDSGSDDVIDFDDASVDRDITKDLSLNHSTATISATVESRDVSENISTHTEEGVLQGKDASEEEANAVAYVEDAGYNQWLDLVAEIPEIPYDDDPVLFNREVTTAIEQYYCRAVEVKARPRGAVVNQIACIDSPTIAQEYLHWLCGNNELSPQPWGERL